MDRLICFTSLLALSITLTACGGSGDNDDTPPATNTTPPTTVTTPPAPSIEGIYTGTSTAQPNDIRSAITGIFLNNKDFYVFYEYENGAGKGAIMGQANVTEGNKFVSDAVDLGTDANLAPLSVSGQAPASELSGTIEYTGVDINASFTGTYDTNYESMPLLTELAGMYSVETINQMSNDSTVQIEILTDGTMTGSNSTCDFVGTVTASATGNIFDLETTFSGDNCLLNTQKLTGIIYYDQINDLIYSGMLLPDRSDAFVFLGKRMAVN